MVFDKAEDGFFGENGKGRKRFPSTRGKLPSLMGYYGMNNCSVDTLEMRPLVGYEKRHALVNGTNMNSNSRSSSRNNTPSVGGTSGSPSSSPPLMESVELLRQDFVRDGKDQHMDIITRVPSAPRISKKKFNGRRNHFTSANSNSSSSNNSKATSQLVVNGNNNVINNSELISSHVEFNSGPTSSSMCQIEYETQNQRNAQDIRTQNFLPERPVSEFPPKCDNFDLSPTISSRRRGNLNRMNSRDKIINRSSPSLFDPNPPFVPDDFVRDRKMRCHRAMDGKAIVGRSLPTEDFLQRFAVSGTDHVNSMEAPTNKKMLIDEHIQDIYDAQNRRFMGRRKFPQQYRPINTEGLPFVPEDVVLIKFYFFIFLTFSSLFSSNFVGSCNENLLLLAVSSSRPPPTLLTSLLLCRVKIVTYYLQCSLL